MSRSSVLYLVAWAIVPVAFAFYIGLAYTRSLSAGLLPFISIGEWKWWVAFAVALVIGASCVASARLKSNVRWIGWSVFYLAAMSAILTAVHAAVACHFGDCI